jgi:hypothetical protein
MGNKLQEVPFKNDIGQTIEPGDRVVAVTTGYGHNVDVRQGVYAGTVNGHPSVLIDVKRWGYWDLDGKNVGWKLAGQMHISGSHRAGTRRTTLQRDRVYAIKD